MQNKKDHSQKHMYYVQATGATRNLPEGWLLQGVSTSNERPQHQQYRMKVPDSIPPANRNLSLPKIDI